MPKTVSSEKYENIKKKLLDWIEAADEYKFRLRLAESQNADYEQEIRDHESKLEKCKEKYQEKITALESEIKELKLVVKNYQKKDKENRLLEGLAERFEKRGKNIRL